MPELVDMSVYAAQSTAKNPVELLSSDCPKFSADTFTCVAPIRDNTIFTSENNLLTLKPVPAVVITRVPAAVLAALVLIAMLWGGNC